MRNFKLHHTEIGQGNVTLDGERYTLHVPPTDTSAYHDAQITDYTLRNRGFSWCRPAQNSIIRMRVQARFNTSDIRGTAGFGFWNHPFSPDMRGLPRLPQAAWFFYGSPPNNMPLAKDVSGYGWKCATINARRWQFLTLAPFTLPGVLLMRVPTFYNALWGIGQNALGIRERLLDASLMTEIHTYEIEWQHDRIIFLVDESIVMESPFRMGGCMGFIAWIDNQYAVITPQGQFAWGLVDVPAPQTLWLESVSVF